MCVGVGGREGFSVSVCVCKEIMCVCVCVGVTFRQCVGMERSIVSQKPHSTNDKHITHARFTPRERWSSRSLRGVCVLIHADMKDEAVSFIKGFIKG